MKKEQINDTASIIAELKTVTEAWSLFERKQLATWRTRFYIGLIVASIIFIIFPTATWVWWLILGLSAFSLIGFAILHYLIQHKLNEAHSKIDLLKELEQQERAETHFHNESSEKAS